MIIKFQGKYDCLYLDTDEKIATLNKNGAVKTHSGILKTIINNHMNTLNLVTDKAIKNFVTDLILCQGVQVDTSDAYSNKSYYAELQKRVIRGL